MRQVLAALLIVHLAGNAGAGAVSGAVTVVDEKVTQERLPESPGRHWLWVSDSSFNRPEGGRAVLVDGDSGRYLGWLSTGVMFMALTLPRGHDAVYSVETYFSRGVRGQRTDVLSIYDPQTLQPVGEVTLPAKRATGMPTVHHSALTDDDRFLIVYNFTPSQSVTVLDTERREITDHTETPGCVLVYPDGPREFHMLCGDGGILALRLDDDGMVVLKRRSDPFFDPRRDPVQEDAVRLGDNWLHASYDSMIYATGALANRQHWPVPWSLLSEEDRALSWRVGGAQLLAVNQGLERLYALMHQGGAHTHEAPGTEVWVYDLQHRRRIQRIRLSQPASSIEVTADGQPLLFTVLGGERDIQVYDALTGEYMESIENVGTFPAMLQAPWRNGATDEQD